MKPSNAIKLIAVCAIAIRAGAALAHEGHAMAGSHWHASDVWGFAAMACVLAAAIWLSRGGK